MIKDLIEKDIKINELQTKIDKAIEYITLFRHKFIYEKMVIAFLDKLLKILGDKE